MEDDEETIESIFDEREWTSEELSAELKKAIDELGWTPVELADRMVSLGDYRPHRTILRGIHRALLGQIKVSGELLALVKQEVRYKRRLRRTYDCLEWTKLPDQSWTTKAEDFIITLLPQTKGRWKVHMMHTETGYSPSWPRWQDSLPKAKEMALLTLDNAINWLAEVEQERTAENQRSPRRAINLAD
ncbi:hypothetical protein BAE36_17300 [Rhizobium leguminosarum bv. trifolii]|uniref:Uncharacterized protein n=1 Tax=Rhizobium leguminosarum bv. trifolii TaxID=386 RepID=A0A1B8RAU6_RHILT|nr:hypothetical protein [Rhizobium leguminosarum]AOO91219.1 hypothetical protein [Rhizobium leguminosarum bv. trifolii]OBY05959.1 hypothetical protein BAE36_17300 [Rhizobium leguminosarum bv. trifolii]